MRVVDGGFGAIAVGSVFEFPRVSTFVEEQAGVIVAFVEVFEDGGEYFGDLFGQIDSLGGGLEKLTAADGGEERRCGEDVLMSCEEALLRADTEGNDGRSQIATRVISEHSAQPLVKGRWTYAATEGFSGFLDLDMSLFFEAVTCCWKDLLVDLLIDTDLPARCLEKLSL